MYNILNIKQKGSAQLSTEPFNIIVYTIYWIMPKLNWKIL